MTSPSLPLDQPLAGATPRQRRVILGLSWFSLIWMTLEGAVGIAAGIQAHSLSLIGWAIGSAIEGLASVIVIWRFTGRRVHSETAERRATRAVAVSFFLLAPYLAIEGVRDLINPVTVEPNQLGIAVTALSVLIMPVLGIAKQRLGRQASSPATIGEGTENLICGVQAAAVLAGLAITAVFHIRWVDPVVALLLAGWAVKEGLEAWRGDDD